MWCGCLLQVISFQGEGFHFWKSLEDSGWGGKVDEEWGSKAYVKALPHKSHQLSDTQSWRNRLFHHLLSWLITFHTLWRASHQLGLLSAQHSFHQNQTNKSLWSLFCWMLCLLVPFSPLWIGVKELEETGRDRRKLIFFQPLLLYLCLCLGQTLP